MTAHDAEHDLALRYASSSALTRISALFALDDALGGILRTAREPLLSQMRLTWWHEALCRLDTARPPAEPILDGLAYEVIPHGVSGAMLAQLINGWEELLDPESLDDAAMLRYADARGVRLFELAGILLGARTMDPIASAGRGWALVDLARHLSDRALAERAAELARPSLGDAIRPRWSRAARPLGALAHIARMNLAVPLDRPLPIGAPWRVARLLFHRLTGR